jgi:acyl-CoA synthetase (NDP forming)/GNAT superfamily N-acetyltransferase
MRAQTVVHPPGYPVEWEADVVLTDGGVAHLRPIRPSDADMLVQFYDRVSPESKYLRFFAPYPKLTDRDVARFTQVDYVDRVALILTVADRMIAVGRYDRLDDNEAEVAFLVEDAHQGRGIAQLLLEHLAEAARERGINRFVAEVLPQNRRMAQIFADAGYRVSKGIQDGVLEVEFPILPTNTSVGAMERREHRAESASVHRLLIPNRVVVYGPGAIVQRIADSVLGGDFRGELICVASDSSQIRGVKTTASIASVHGQIDLALVFVRSDQLGDVVIEAAHKGAHGIVLLTGSQVKPADSLTLINLARAYGIRALGPDALGLINTHVATSLNATPGPMPRSGGVGLFCQSAAVGIAQLNHAVEQQIGLSSFVSTGGYADVTANDVIQYWEDDEDTRVCLLSLDSIGNPRKFSRLARRLARRKPVVVFAPGQVSWGSHAGDRGGLGHSPDVAVDALFRQAGVMVVHQRSAMYDIAKIAARQPLPNGPRVGLVTNSSGLAQQMLATVRGVGLVCDMEPILLADDVNAPTVAGAVRSAMAGDCDAVVCAIVRVFDGGTEAVHDALTQVAATATKPVIGALLGFRAAPEVEWEPDVWGGLPSFDGPTSAIHALAAVSAYAHWRQRDPGAVPMLDNDTDRARRLVNSILTRQSDGRELSDAETSELLSAYGIDVVPRYRVDNLEQAIEVAERLGWNVVLKATADLVRGRPDLASVRRNLDRPEEMAEAWHDLTLLVRGLGLDDENWPSVAEPAVQAMAPPGVALVITSREDAAFGPIISLGLDGIPSELLGDIVYRVPPLTTVDAAAMVRDLRAAPTLFGHNGRLGVDVGAIENLLHRIAQLADDLPQLASLTLKPCVAARRGVAVLGARTFIAPTADRRDPLARTL